MNILLRAPVLSQSGYGEHARFILRSLRRSENKVYVVNTAWGQSSWIYENNEERAWFDERLINTIGYMSEKTDGPKFDLSIQVGLPDEWTKMAAKNIGVTAGIETDKVLDSWDTSAQGMDAIIVPSEHSKSGFSEKTQEKIKVISFPARTHEPDLNVDDRLDNITTDFNFLTVAQVSPRKNVDTSLLAFLEEFQNHKDVGYILKLNIRNNSLTDRRFTEASISSMLDNYPDRKCKVYLLHGHMTDSEMAALYSSGRVSAYVSASHGEGFGLPIFEVAQAAKPIIAPNWSGYTDFTSIKGKTHLIEVQYELKEVKGRESWEGVLDPESKWAYVKMDDLRAQMKDIYINNEKHEQRAKKLKTHISDKYTESKQTLLVQKVIKETTK